MLSASDILFAWFYAVLISVGIQISLRNYESLWSGI